MTNATISERNRLPTYEITHLLTLEGVRLRTARQEAFTSAPFSCPDDPNQTEFMVQIKFGSNELNWLSCHLYPSETDVFIKKATMRVSDIHCNVAQSFSFEGKQINKGTGWGPPKLLDLKNFSFPDDSIRFQCDILYVGEPKSDDSPSLLVRDPNLHNDLLRLFTEARDADVAIVVKDKKFMAHKALLKVRSDYFRALFESGLEESRENEVHQRYSAVCFCHPSCLLLDR